MSQEDGWVPPPQHFAPPPRPSDTVVLPVVPLREQVVNRRRTALVTVAVVGVLVAAGLALAAGGDEKRPAPLFVAEPVPPAEASSPAGPAPSRPAPPPTTKVREVVTPPGTTRPTTRKPSASATPAVALPVVGAVLGLEPLGEPGRRVRHRNFVARIDPVGPASPELDRMDSRFTVRTGRSGAGCLSFESVNYPGYFLRARDQSVRLERPDRRSRGFNTDATFCAVPATSGGFALRSRNTPDRYVTARADQLSMTRVPPADAKAFVTRPPV
jgi:alpha-L-arabinofuranosidase B-like protein